MKGLSYYLSKAKSMMKIKATRRGYNWSREASVVSCNAVTKKVIKLALQNKKGGI